MAKFLAIMQSGRVWLLITVILRTAAVVAADSIRDDDALLPAEISVDAFSL